MIQPTGIDNEEKVEACHVHAMVFDLICSLASEENFVAILDGTERKMPNLHSRVRRLSVQNSKVDLATIDLGQVRSLTVFTDKIADQLKEILSSQVLRVLDLEGCDISDIGYVGNLLHLRYLELRYDGIYELPMEIGNLQLLQTMDISGRLFG
jgi:Leucine-rich repeat (LRR) protein